MKPSIKLELAETDSGWVRTSRPYAQYERWQRSVKYKDGVDPRQQCMIDKQAMIEAKDHPGISGVSVVGTSPFSGLTVFSSETDASG